MKRSSVKASPASAKPTVHAPIALRPSRGLWITLAIGTIVLMMAGALAADWYIGVPEGAQATYIGRNSCIECHKNQHEQFTGSHHDLAMDVATDESVLGDFNDAELEHHGDKSRMFRKGKQFFISTEGPDGKLADFEIKYVFGVTPLQQYMVEFDRPADLPANEIARLQVLRVSWDTIQKKWFHLDPPDVKEKLDPSDMLHWTGFAQCWNHMCADCHSTNLQKNFDVANKQYHTTFSEIDVSCESCHGPASLHVQMAKSVSPFWDRKRGYGLAKLKVKDNVPQVEMCATCHSRRRGVAPNYQAGCGYYDYFANDLLHQNIYYADGQIQDEVYEYGSFCQSKMFHKGIKCSDCHNPHSLKLKYEGNKLCTSCHQHPSAKYDTPNHHHHKEGSTGASCVECHMPATTYMEVDPRRDHSLRIPRPDLSVQLGTGNACSGCHLQIDPNTAALREQKKIKGYADWLRLGSRGDDAIKTELKRVDQWSDDHVEKWFGKQRKKEPHFAEALHASRTNAENAQQKLLELLAKKTMPPIARATAALELRQYLPPNQASDSGVTKALGENLKDPDPQVRAACVLALQGTNDNNVRRLLMPLLDDRVALVRTEAARILARLPDSEFDGQTRPKAKAAWDEIKAQAGIMNDRAEGHIMLGVLAESRGELAEAQRAYETAISVQPGLTGPRGQLAMLLERLIQDAEERAQGASQRGDKAGVEAALGPIPSLTFEVEKLREEELSLVERDARLLPEEALMQQQLGFARHTQGWRKEAGQALLNAWLLDPSPQTAYALAIFYRDTGWPQKALELVHAANKDQAAPPHMRGLEEELTAELKAKRVIGPALQ